MNARDYYAVVPGEKPLDRMVTDGGFTGIFRSICCIGDSLSSGEFESLDADGNVGYHDMFEFSWGQFIARDAGAKVFNFSRGGMTGKEYIESFAEANGFWDTDKLCQCYIIALGVNDLFGLKQELGTVSDMEPDENGNYKETFAAYYGRIIKRLKDMNPDAYFFFMSMPKNGDDGDPQREAHASLLYDFAKRFTRSHVIDLYKYAPVYDAEFRSHFFMSGHLNPAGYLLTARMVESYIDFIVRSQPELFSKIGYIGTPYDNVNYIS